MTTSRETIGEDTYAGLLSLASASGPGFVRLEPRAATAILAALGAWSAPPGESFQERARRWAYECFGPDVVADREERCHRFVEEAIELAQACGCRRGDVEALVGYVYARDPGERAQEIGGVMMTLAVLCTAFGLDLESASKAELTRVWERIPQIRMKHRAKPRGSALPGYAAPAPPTRSS